MNSEMQIGDVLIAAPDARGKPLAADYCVGVVAEKALDGLRVCYEQKPWKPKKGVSAVHSTSIKIGTWAKGDDSFDVSVDESARGLVQPLLGDPLAAEFLHDVPSRAKTLCCDAVVGTKRRRTTVVDLEREDEPTSPPLLCVQIAEQNAFVGDEPCGRCRKMGYAESATPDARVSWLLQ